MKSKLILVFFVWAVFLMLAWDKMTVIAILMYGPLVGYFTVKLMMKTAEFAILGTLFKTNAVKEYEQDLSIIKNKIVNHRYEEALQMLDELDSDSVEACKLKMELLHEKFNTLQQALNLGIDFLESKERLPGHIRVLNLCVDICLDAGDRRSAVYLLEKYGPQMTEKADRDNCSKRMQALSRKETLALQGETISL